MNNLPRKNVKSPVPGHGSYDPSAVTCNPVDALSEAMSAEFEKVHFNDNDTAVRLKTVFESALRVQRRTAAQGGGIAIWVNGEGFLLDEEARRWLRQILAAPGEPIPKGCTDLKVRYDLR